MNDTSIMASRPQDQRRYRTLPESLAELRANAIRASIADPDKGDSWHRSHGCVLSAAHTIMFPADNRHYVHPFKPDPVNEANYIRHVVGAEPRTVIQLCDEIAYLRARLAELEQVTIAEATDEFNEVTNQNQYDAGKAHAKAVLQTCADHPLATWVRDPQNRPRRSPGQSDHPDFERGYWDHIRSVCGIDKE